MKYELKLENPKEFYCMEHRPSHFLHFGVRPCPIRIHLWGNGLLGLRPLSALYNTLPWCVQAVEAELADLGTDREDVFS
jgi:hypothetical protein|eukprot:COSAG02_NODE_14757_length_1239_cov_1.477193_1_plen_79_part_00